MGILAFLLFIVCGALGLLLWISRLQSNKQDAENRERIQELTERNQLLSRYEGILEIDREIAVRQQRIEQEQARAEAEIKNLHREAELEIKETKREIGELNREMQEMQAKALDSATRQAAQIVTEANRKADEIAGDAMAALRDSKQIEATAKAMTNIIKGYGDEYLVPGHSLLDDLAEEYSHKEAGVELKTARKHSREILKSGLAAECDYVETKRKETAIRFVLDAFNGKVDTILSNAKHDNFGKLDQEIKDAFAVVNYNGGAFRNARIIPAYMDARRAELRWAVVVNELRIKEREEQREIKEQMREEERARREYEKAIKEAAKEEKMLQEALEKARKELEGASAEQKAEFERQLKELEQKLHEAEEKNQRAISMAQQTKQGHVYVISNIGSFGDDVFKIGLTRRLEPTDRVRELSDASVPFEFDIHAMIFSKDAPALESELHNLFRDHQVNLVNPRKEFFRLEIAKIKKVVQELGIEARWTMVAEAHEYRDTLATLKAHGQEVRVLPPPDPKVTFTSAPAAEAFAGANKTPEPSSANPEQVQLPVASSEPSQRDGNGKQTSASSPTHVNAKERTLPCPGCKTPLTVSTLRAGHNTCPHCGKGFNVKSKSATASHRT